jgi:hypothetical protein
MTARLRLSSLLWTLCILLSVSGISHAQPVANPTALEFNASADHAAVTPVTGAAVLTRYEARYYLASSCTLGTGKDQCPATTPAFTLNLAKPAPVSGVINVTNVFQGLVLNQTYKAVVVAVGPGGASASVASNPFGNETVSPPAAPASIVIR